MTVGEHDFDEITKCVLAIEAGKRRQQDDDTGFGSMPFRYSGDPSGKETIDVIREQLGDEGFCAFCLGTAIKYESRAGRKGPAETDLTKALFYRMMRDHVLGLGPDPRVHRWQLSQAPLPFVKRKD
jgi:hypothetical protein